MLGNLLGLPGFEFDTSEQMRDAVLGRRATLAAQARRTRRASRWSMPPKAAGGVERVADVPIYFADPLVRRVAVAAERPRDAQAAEGAAASARCSISSGCAEGAQVTIRQGRGEAVLAPQVDPRGAAGLSCASRPAHPSTAALGAMFGCPVASRPSSER